MDPLSDVLALLKLRSFVAAGFDAGGDWSVAFAAHEGIKLYAVASGECWLSVEGVDEPVRVQTGDCFVLPRGRPCAMASSLALPPVAATTLFPGARAGGIISYQGGGDFFSVGGHFTLEGHHARTLLELLPPIVHIRKESDRADLRWCLERMRQELRDPQPGGFLVAQNLAYMMLIQALRLHLAEGSANATGWLRALADRQMSAALRAMHGDPAHRWTVQELAQRAAMSRTTFTVGFKATVGTAPMEYLTRWRMLLAGDRLTSSGDAVSAIAFSLGYESESAFSTAFRRVMGCSPRQYARRHRPLPGRAHGPQPAVVSA